MRRLVLPPPSSEGVVRRPNRSLSPKLIASLSRTESSDGIPKEEPLSKPRLRLLSRSFSFITKVSKDMLQRPFNCKPIQPREAIEEHVKKKTKLRPWNKQKDDAENPFNASSFFEEHQSQGSMLSKVKIMQRSINPKVPSQVAFPESVKKLFFESKKQKNLENVISSICPKGQPESLIEEGAERAKNLGKKKPKSPKDSLNQNPEKAPSKDSDELEGINPISEREQCIIVEEESLSQKIQITPTFKPRSQLSDKYSHEFPERFENKPVHNWNALLKQNLESLIEHYVPEDRNSFPASDQGAPKSRSKSILKNPFSYKSKGKKKNSVRWSIMKDNPNF